MSTTTANPFTVASRFAKAAATPVTPATFRADLENKAWGDVGQMAMLSLGVGAAGRGLAGLANLVRRRVAPPQATYPGAIVTRVPYPVAPVEEDEEKVAGFMSALAPEGATERTALPMYGLMMAGTGLAGLYGGWKGVDAVLDRRRVAQQAAEKEEAKKEFEQALLGGYGQPQAKTAAAPSPGRELGELLDRIYDALPEEKRASWLGNTMGQGAGAYLGFYALPTALLAGHMAYSRQQKGSQRALLDRAMKARVQRAYATRPSEVYAVPVPVAREQAEQPSPEEAEAGEEAAGQVPARPRRFIDRPHV